MDWRSGLLTDLILLARGKKLVYINQKLKSINVLMSCINVHAFMNVNH